jgi:plasmid stabilization system protein ParE
LTLIVKVKPRARREINAAAEWWSLHRLSAPGAVAADLKEALDLLVEFPGIGTTVKNAKDPETRRWWLSRIGYHIYYRPRGRHLEVVAFWGGGREHGPSV